MSARQNLDHEKHECYVSCDIELPSLSLQKAVVDAAIFRCTQYAIKNCSGFFLYHSSFIQLLISIKNTRWSGFYVWFPALQTSNTEKYLSMCSSASLLYFARYRARILNGFQRPKEFKACHPRCGLLFYPQNEYYCQIKSTITVKTCLVLCCGARIRFPILQCLLDVENCLSRTLCSRSLCLLSHTTTFYKKSSDALLAGSFALKLLRSD